jgi:hypothetical protein
LFLEYKDCSASIERGIVLLAHISLHLKNTVANARIETKKMHNYILNYTRPQALLA